MEISLAAKSLEEHFRRSLGECRLRGLTPLGRGAHGQGFLLELDTREGVRRYVLKSVRPEGLGHDYPADRAGLFLLAYDTFGLLPAHVRALDVLAEREDGSFFSVAGGREYYLVMEEVRGEPYMRDLEAMAGRDALRAEDRAKIRAMTEYLAGIHALKRESRSLYLRKIRDVIGHGECLMGVFDAYPEGVIPAGEMAAIEKKCVDWRLRLRKRTHRLCQIHGDFHPGNIWWEGRPERTGDGEQEDREDVRGWRGRMRLLDRSRGPWGEAADDLTALSINYVFLSLKHRGAFTGACVEALKLFFDAYVRATGDTEVLEVLAPFFAFRGAVVANPAFYPELGDEGRRLLFRFVHNVLDRRSFAPEEAEALVSGA
ncbi:MAG: phosphotransferase [Nitrospirota bacterium]|jgi:hypothetical protein